jgi:tetratricopeptide (TPR) repeat protein/TolB-like protein/DNA-binding winged helix-turn-helix (wHTH) protein
MQTQGQTGTVLLPGDILVPRHRPDVRMQRSLLKGFYLHDLLIEPTSGTVSGPDGDQHLKPKAIEILLYLSERPFELVERQALLQAVWGEDQGSQEALSHAISELRSGLGDHADDPQLIQTVPTRGYRLLRKPRFVDGPDAASTPEVGDEHSFIGSLMRRGVVQAGLAYLIFSWLLIQVADAVTPILGLPPWFPSLITYSAIGGMPLVLVLAWLLEQSDGHLFLDRGKQSGRMLSGLERNYLSIFVAYIMAVIGASTYQVVVGFDVPAANGVVVAEEDVLLPVRPNSIAVLKFLNINNDDTARAFSDGLGEDILDRLARIPGLSVSSRGDSWSLPDNASSDVVRKRLRVAYFLEGSVRLIDDDLRVVVQLIESATGFHVFSRSFDTKVRDHMSVQREITDLAVANLRIALPEGENTQLSVTDIDPHPDAYVLYRLGKTVLDQPPNAESIDKAVNFFEQALNLDPDFSAAHSGICRAHVTRYELTNDATSIELAESACAAALSANPNLHVVYTALGQLRLSTGAAMEAEAAIQRALEINPNDVLAMRGMAAIFERQQKFDDAERMLQTTIDLQPGNWRSIDRLGALYFYQGRYADAARAYRQVVFLDPGNWLGHGNLGGALLMSGEFDAALEAIQKSLSIEDMASQRSNLATIYYYLGEYDKSVEIYQQATEAMPDAHFSWLNLGDALRFSSRPDEAPDAYRRAVDISMSLLEVNPNNPVDLLVLAWATASLKDANEAKRLIERALAIAPSDPYVHYYDGLLKNDRGEHETAVAALRLAVEMGYPVAMLAADPLLGKLHGDAGFEKMLHEYAGQPMD